LNSLNIMIGLSLLVGFVAAGFVWFGWEALARLGAAVRLRQRARRLQRDAEALLNQSREKPGGAEKP
jgi:hypothetical protein